MSLGVHKIEYGSPKHALILDAIRKRRKLSYDKMSERYTIWNKNDESFIAYIPEKESDRLRRGKRDSGSPQYTTIEVPYGYAILMTMHTYHSSVFLSRNPILQFIGRHGETEDQIRAVEAVMDYQTQVGGHLVPYYLWILDGLKYGIGIIGHYWDEEEHIVSQIREVPRTFGGIPIPGAAPVKKRVTERVKGYTGNRVYNIRPHDFFPDPRVPIWKLQEGEFCGREVDTGWTNILEKAAAGEYYNTDVLKRMREGSSRDADTDGGTSQLEFPDTANTQLDDGNIKDVGFTRLLEMHIKLVPRDWGLGSSSHPEKWVFTVANQKVIISARPLGLYHNKFPFDTWEPELHGYAHMNRAPLEITKPMNDIATWLVNSHFYNVRKVMNDQLVFDPSRIDMGDLTNPAPGKLIRLLPSAYGTDPRLAIHQLQVMDVTRGHIQDTQFIMDLMHRTMGVNDAIMGMLSPGGRKTATEVRQSSSFGVNRLKTQAELGSAQGFYPHATKMVQTTQQFMDSQRMYRIAGRLAENVDRFVNVRPEDIQGFYDFVPVDGTMPIDKFALANTWKEIMFGMAKFPELLGRYDVGKVFAYVAELAGAKNIQQFQIKVGSPQDLQNRAASGELIPMGGPNGAGRSGPSPSGAARGAGRVPQPRQVAGMGPTA